jgi:serine/threonine protein phosphatase PrpC
MRNPERVGARWNGKGVEWMLSFSGVAVTHRGLVRSGNEDSGFVGPTCMLVADGVGGAAAGEVASATAAYVVCALALVEPYADPLRMLRGGVHLAQEQVAAGVRQDPARAGMATTLTAVATDGETFALAHLGDSRGYVFRGGRLALLTSDHTYVQRLVDAGNLDPADVSTHPWRNVVMRSVNGDPAESGEVTPVHFAVGDRVLLASDGLTDLVPDVRIEALLDAHHDDAAADALLDAALAAGGHDNITCLLATVVDRPPVVADALLVGAVRDPRNVVDPAAVRMTRSA